MASKIEDIIDEIEAYVETCKPAAFSSSKIVVNKDELEGLLAELKSNTPEEIKKYQRIISNQDRILNDAKAKAENMVADAEAKAQELLNENDILRQAYEQANQIIDLANSQAQGILDDASRDGNEIRSSAIEYTDALLAGVQQVIENSTAAAHSSYEAALQSIQSNDEQLSAAMQSYLDVIRQNRAALVPEEDEAAPAAEETQEEAPAAEAEVPDELFPND